VRATQHSSCQKWNGALRGVFTNFSGKLQSVAATSTATSSLFRGVMSFRFPRRFMCEPVGPAISRNNGNTLGDSILAGIARKLKASPVRGPNFSASKLQKEPTGRDPMNRCRTKVHHRAKLFYTL